MLPLFTAPVCQHSSKRGKTPPAMILISHKATGFATNE
jgi:hypothetical protein